MASGLSASDILRGRSFSINRTAPSHQATNRRAFRSYLYSQEEHSTAAFQTDVTTIRQCQLTDLGIFRFKKCFGVPASIDGMG